MKINQVFKLETKVKCEKGHIETVFTNLAKIQPYYHKIGWQKTVKVGCKQCAIDNGKPDMYSYKYKQTIEKIEMSLKDAKWMFSDELDKSASIEQIQKVINEAPYPVKIFDKGNLILENTKSVK